jgi:hypothetical protein
VLKPTGEAFVTVWNRWQPRFWLRGKEVNVPWKAREKTYYRYYYLYTYQGLRSILTETGFEIVSIFPERANRFPFKSFSENICVLVRK